MTTAALARVFRFNTAAGRIVRRLRRRRARSLLTIVAYHRVGDGPDAFSHGGAAFHTLRQLDAHMEYLATHFRPVALRNALATIDRGHPLDRAVIVTFDDGLADSLRVAAPILRRHGIPMTIGVCTSVVGNRDLLWRHKLAWLEANGHGPSLRSALIDALRPTDDTTQPDESLAAFTRRCYRHAVIPRLLDEFLARAGTSAAELAARHRLYLEPEQIASADRDWIDFANHTHAHPVLSQLTEAQQAAEIATARDLLHKWTGRPPTALILPFGLKDAYTSATVRIAEQLGHRVVLDLRRRLNPAGRPPLDWSRFPAPNGSEEEFAQVVEAWPGGPADESVR